MRFIKFNEYFINKSSRRNYIVEYFLKFEKKFNLNIFLIDKDKNIQVFLTKYKKLYLPPAKKKKI